MIERMMFECVRSSLPLSHLHMMLVCMNIIFQKAHPIQNCRVSTNRLRQHTGLLLYGNFKHGKNLYSQS